MRRSAHYLAATVVLLLASATIGAEIQTIFERNESRSATASFQFKNVPAPSRTDAATNARFTIAAGRSDLHGGEADTLHDGKLPASEDEPEANFFFDAGTQGGRVVVDLGKVAEIKQVNTYSWHRSTRGPQVYRLYGSERSPQDLLAKAAGDADLVQSGWTLIASVDTRPKQGPPGGQYGVTVARGDHGALGKYRCLLFDVSCTEKSNPFGNTFFSEIDVDDGQEHATDVASKADPDALEIDFDTSEMPELKPWVDTKLRPVCLQLYPIIVKMLSSEGYTAPRRFSVIFKKDMRGVAATGGTRILCAGDWFKKNLEGEAIGAVVHEMVHVVQQYGRTRGSNRNPGWLVEGVADYLRWFKFEPPSLRPRPNPARAKYTDSYRTTAAFLNYVTQMHDPDVVKKLNAAMREGKYSPELWKTYTGKTVDELWAEYIKTLDKP